MLWLKTKNNFWHPSATKMPLFIYAFVFGFFDSRLLVRFTHDGVCGDGLLIFHGCIVFHQMSIAQFIFLFYCWWIVSSCWLLLTHLVSNKLILLNGKSQSWQSRAAIYRFRILDLELLGFSVKNVPNHRERFLVVSWPVLGDICNNLRLYFGGFQNHCRWWSQPWN